MHVGGCVCTCTSVCVHVGVHLYIGECVRARTWGLCVYTYTWGGCVCTSTSGSVFLCACTCWGALVFRGACVCAHMLGVHTYWGVVFALVRQGECVSTHACLCMRVGEGGAYMTQCACMFKPPGLSGYLRPAEGEQGPQLLNQLSRP